MSRENNKYQVSGWTPISAGIILHQTTGNRRKSDQRRQRNDEVVYLRVPKASALPRTAARRRREAAHFMVSIYGRGE